MHLKTIRGRDQKAKSAQVALICCQRALGKSAERYSPGRSYCRPELGGVSAFDPVLAMLGGRDGDRVLVSLLILGVAALWLGRGEHERERLLELLGRGEHPLALLGRGDDLVEPLGRGGRNPFVLPCCGGFSPLVHPPVITFSLYFRLRLLTSG